MSYVSGTINGNEILGYVISLQRTHHICNPCQLATITLSPTFGNTVMPGQDVVLYENGIKVFTGYVIKCRRDRLEANWVVECQDTYHRVIMTFIEDKITIGLDEFDEPIPDYVEQSTDYWIGYLCGLAGVAYNIDPADSRLVPQGVQIGLRSVHESLTDIIAYSCQFVYADPDGVLQFRRTVRNVADREFSSGIELNDSISDEMTRNVIKVYGYQGVRNRIFSSASRSVPGIVPDRITAVGNPMIQTQAEADRVSGYLLDELGSQTRVVSLLVPGDPTIEIGKAARINVESTDYTDVITSTDSKTDGNGYVTRVTIGERCPRISGWSKRFPPIFAGTTNSGLYKSPDLGVTWEDFNKGLPAGTKYVKGSAFNSLEEGMAIVNGRLYYTDGTSGSWVRKPVPSPTDSSGSTGYPFAASLVQVDSTGAYGGFDLLVSGAAQTSGSDPSKPRGWLYETSDSGSSWTITQLYTDVSFNPNYDVYPMDLSCRYGFPYITVASGSMWIDIVEVSQLETEGLTTYTAVTESGYGLVCEAGTPVVRWWVDYISTSIEMGATSATIKIVIEDAHPKDNVFLYGGNPGKTSPDHATYGMKWPFQVAAAFDGYTEEGNTRWEAVVIFDTEMRETVMGPGLSIMFGIFYSKWHSFNKWSSVVGDRDCEFFRVGDSYYGDVGSSAQWQVIYPYPVRSKCAAGSISLASVMISGPLDTI